MKHIETIRAAIGRTSPKHNAELLGVIDGLTDANIAAAARLVRRKCASLSVGEFSNPFPLQTPEHERWALGWDAENADQALVADRDYEPVRDEQAPEEAPAEEPENTNPPEEENSEVMLVGSSEQPSLFAEKGDPGDPPAEVQLGTVVVAAQTKSGMTVEAWNTMPDDLREQAIAEMVEEMNLERHPNDTSVLPSERPTIDGGDQGGDVQPQG